jgi:hypothetical protein
LGDIDLRLTLIASLVALIAAGPAASAEQIFNCRIPNPGTGIIREAFRFVIDEDQRTATVFDPLIAAFANTPQKARFSRKSDGQLLLRWQVSKIPVTSSLSVDGYWFPEKNGTAKVWFKVILNPGTGQITVQAILPGASGVVKHSGICNGKPVQIRPVVLNPPAVDPGPATRTPRAPAQPAGKPQKKNGRPVQDGTWHRNCYNKSYRRINRISCKNYPEQD